MPPVPLSRRAFLAATGGVVLGAATGIHARAAFAAEQLEWGALTIDPYASPDPQRFGFALETTKRRFASGPKAEVAFAFGARAKPKAPYSRATLHAKGLPKKRGIYTVEAVFPQAGAWQATVNVAGQRITAFCESRYCGPVLDDLLTLVGQFQDRITFVHVEIYTSLQGGTTVPAVDAWGLPGEPWLFGVDATGSVVSRLDGAFGHDEQQQLLQGLVS